MMPNRSSALISYSYVPQISETVSGAGAGIAGSVFVDTGDRGDEVLYERLCSLKKEEKELLYLIVAEGCTHIVILAEDYFK